MLEDAEISQEHKGFLLRSFIIFPFAAWSFFFWCYHLEDTICSYLSNYLNYLFNFIVHSIWLCNQFYHKVKG